MSSPSSTATAWTFLFTDVEGSTRLWEQNPRAMRSPSRGTTSSSAPRSPTRRARSSRRPATGSWRSSPPRSAPSPRIAAQRALLAEPWPALCAIRVRMGIHTGEAESRGGDYFGPAVNRTARIMAAGHGGQILLSDATAALVDGRPPGDGARCAISASTG